MQQSLQDSNPYFWVMAFVCYNGNFVQAHEALFTSQNRSFRYGDGVFETIKVFNKKILLNHLHFQRLFSSLELLQVNNNLNADVLQNNITALCTKNMCSALARVRLAVFRGDNNKAEYIIEAVPLSLEANQWNEKGWTIDICPGARKSNDIFANLKSANFLPYVLAGLYAKEKNAMRRLC